MLNPIQSYEITTTIEALKVAIGCLPLARRLPRLPRLGRLRAGAALRATQEDGFLK